MSLLGNPASGATHPTSWWKRVRPCHVMHPVQKCTSQTHSLRTKAQCNQCTALPADKAGRQSGEDCRDVLRGPRRHAPCLLLVLPLTSTTFLPPPLLLSPSFFASILYVLRLEFARTPMVVSIRSTSIDRQQIGGEIGGDAKHSINLETISLAWYWRRKGFFFR